MQSRTVKFQINCFNMIMRHPVKYLRLGHFQSAFDSVCVKLA